MASTTESGPVAQYGLGNSPPEIATESSTYANGVRSELEQRLSGRSILLLHKDSFVGSYISTVLASANAIVLWPASIGDGRDLFSAGVGIDAAVLDFDMSSEDSHALVDELARQALPHMFVRARVSCEASRVLRGRLSFTWPFAGFQVREAVAAILHPAQPAVADHDAPSSQSAPQRRLRPTRRAASSTI